MAAPESSLPDISVLPTYAATREVLETKYNDSFAWAQYAASVLEGKLSNINTKAGEFDISEFIDAARNAIAEIETITAGTITYTAPEVPTYNEVPTFAAPDAPEYTELTAYVAPLTPGYTVIPSYVAPDSPTYAELQEYVAPDSPAYTTMPTYVAPASPDYAAIPSYAAPDSPVYDAIVFTSPVAETLQTVPTPTVHTAGAVPQTTMVFANETFTDGLVDGIRTALAVKGTGLGDAEQALFNRETARQNDARAKAYQEITSQFAARGFDMPPGALLAKMTEMNNESNIRLSDSSSQIMAESAKLTQEWNKTILATAAQTVDILARVFDSRIMRDFEAGKNNVLMTLEAFKASIAVVVANAQLEGVYIGAVGAYDEALIKKYTGEISGQSALVGAMAQSNQSKAAVFQAEIQGAIAPITAGVEINKALVSAYVAEIQGATVPLTTAVEINKSLVSAYVAEIQGATAPLAATAEINKSLATTYTAEVQGAQVPLTAAVEVNKALVSAYVAEIQGAVAPLSAQAENNKALATGYTAEVQGAIAPITAIAESNKALATAYSAAVQGAATDVQAQGERERALATAGEINSRKALGISDITTKYALQQMSIAKDKYLGEIQMMQALAGQASQMVCSALSSVSVSSSLGYSASSSATIANSTNQHYTKDGEANPSLPRLS